MTDYLYEGSLKILTSGSTDLKIIECSDRLETGDYVQPLFGVGDDTVFCRADQGDETLQIAEIHDRQVSPTRDYVDEDVRMYLDGVLRAVMIIKRYRIRSRGQKDNYK